MLAQSIIGSSFYVATGATPTGSYLFNGATTSYYYASASPALTPYNFPNNTTSNVINYNSYMYQSTRSFGTVGNFWINMWIYPTSSNIAIMTETDNTTSPGYYYNMLEIDASSYIRAGVWNGGTITSITSNDKIIVNAWNHIYFYFKDGLLSVEVNGGTPATQSGVTRSGPTSSYFLFGYSSDTAMATSNTYIGYTENSVEFWTTEHGSNYNIFKSKYQAQKVMALLGSSYGGSGPWIDSVLNRSFTLINSPTWSSVNGGQFRFDAASSQWADSGSGNSIASLPSFTVQGVFKLATAPTSGVPCLITENWPGNGTKINYAIGFINSFSNISGGFFDANGGYWNTADAIASPSTNTWYDVVCSYYGPTKELKTYVNGTLINTVTAVGTATTDNAGIRIARRWDAEEYLDCTVKDINIWSGVLTPSEIANQHTPYNSLV